MSNSARNGKKNWRQIAIFGGSGGTAAVFFNYVKCLQKVNFYLFLQSVLGDN